jgi:hypothetical protein
MLPTEEEMLAQMQMSKTIGTQDMLEMSKHVLREITENSRDSGLNAVATEAPVPEIASSPELPESPPTLPGIDPSQMDESKRLSASTPSPTEAETRSTRSKQVASFGKSTKRIKKYKRKKR